MARPRSSSKNATANFGFEAKLWLAADKSRSNVDAAGVRIMTSNFCVRYSKFALRNSFSSYPETWPASSPMAARAATPEAKANLSNYGISI
jgi:hypothetical protein